MLAYCKYMYVSRIQFRLLSVSHPYLHVSMPQLRNTDSGGLRQEWADTTKLFNRFRGAVLSSRRLKASGAISPA